MRFKPITDYSRGLAAIPEDGAYNKILLDTGVIDPEGVKWKATS